MSESVNLPALGESVTEGTITRWLKSVGDNVEVDEPLLEVSTDKVDTEIPSPVAGTVLAIKAEEEVVGEGGGGGGAPEDEGETEPEESEDEPEESSDDDPDDSEDSEDSDD